jgi:sugar phosphate isomerase/epimerase
MRRYSLAYLTAASLSVPQMLVAAAQLGYATVGLRLQPNAPGAPHQPLLGDAALLREALAVQRGTGVGVFDLEIIRLAEGFDPAACRPLLDAGAALGAKAVLVAGDDPDPARLADSYARLCAYMQPYGLTADLEFMPWTAVPNAQAALRTVSAAGHPANAGILVDALHVARSDTTLDDLRAIPPGLLHYAQACDAADGTGFTTEQLVHTARCERLLPGEGVIDVAAIFAALPGDLPVSVEIPHHLRAPLLGDVEWARQALAATRSVLSKA